MFYVQKDETKFRQNITFYLNIECDCLARRFLSRCLDERDGLLLCNDKWDQVLFPNTFILHECLDCIITVNAGGKRTWLTYKVLSYDTSSFMCKA